MEERIKFDFKTNLVYNKYNEKKEKITMNVSLGALQATEPILSRVVSLKLPISLSYKVHGLLKIVQPEIDFYYQQLNAIIAEYAEKDEEGKYVTTNPQSIKIQEDKLPECQQKLNELNSISASNEFDVFTLDDLDKLSTAGFTLTPSEMEAFEIFIK